MKWKTFDFSCQYWILNFDTETVCVWKVFFISQFKNEMEIEEIVNFDFCINIE